MTNTPPANNLVSKERFKDFRLEAEYKLSPKGNSGIYLRGRYEMQVLDDAGTAPEAHGHMAIYSRRAPDVNASKPAGEWQTVQITIVGNCVTAVLNGKTVHNNAQHRRHHRRGARRQGNRARSDHDPGGSREGVVPEGDGDADHGRRPTRRSSLYSVHGPARDACGPTRRSRACSRTDRLRRERTTPARRHIRRDAAACSTSDRPALRPENSPRIAGAFSSSVGHRLLERGPAESLVPMDLIEVETERPDRDPAATSQLNPPSPADRIDAHRVDRHRTVEKPLQRLERIAGARERRLAQTPLGLVEDVPGGNHVVAAVSSRPPVADTRSINARPASSLAIRWPRPPSCRPLTICARLAEMEVEQDRHDPRPDDAPPSASNASMSRNTSSSSAGRQAVASKRMPDRPSHSMKNRTREIPSAARMARVRSSRSSESLRGPIRPRRARRSCRSRCRSRSMAGSLRPRTGLCSNRAGDNGRRSNLTKTGRRAGSRVPAPSDGAAAPGNAAPSSTWSARDR